MNEAKFLLIPVGEVEAEVLAHICLGLQDAYDHECILGSALPKPEDAFNSHRGQYSANEILQRLRAGNAKRVLGVVDLDLYVPDLNFVFGLADPYGRRAVIAIPRLRQEYYGLPEDRGVFQERVLKEAVHELGHTYGLGHCHNHRCVMAFSNSLADTDYKAHTFCQKCQDNLASWPGLS
jgi:archaemetzincin